MSDPFRRAARIADVELSEILQISEAAAAMKKAGRDVISLGTGEPDFPTPAPVIEAAYKAALAGETSYTATVGTLALRQAIAARLPRTEPASPVETVDAGQWPPLRARLLGLLEACDTECLQLFEQHAGQIRAALGQARYESVAQAIRDFDFATAWAELQRGPDQDRHGSPVPDHGAHRVS